MALTGECSDTTYNTHVALTASGGECSDITYDLHMWRKLGVERSAYIQMYTDVALTVEWRGVQ